jgi:hypothetical protein
VHFVSFVVSTEFAAWTTYLPGHVQVSQNDYTK